MSRPGLIIMMILLLMAAWVSGCTLVDHPLEETAAIEMHVVEQLPLRPGELIHISGTGAFTSEPFALEGEGEVEVFWKQDCQVFYLAMVNADEALAKGPNGVIIFESAASPSENTETDDFRIPYPYIAGDYSIRVQGEGGTWEVWARTEPAAAE
jgi:hypothetical protein